MSGISGRITRRPGLVLTELYEPRPLTALLPQNQWPTVDDRACGDIEFGEYGNRWICTRFAGHGAEHPDGSLHIATDGRMAYALWSRESASTPGQPQLQLAARHIELKRDADIEFAKSMRRQDRINDFQVMVLIWLAHTSHDCAARILGSQHLPSSALPSASWEADLEHALYGLSVELLYPVMATVPVKRVEEAVDAHGLGAVIGGQSRDMATAPTLLALKALASELNEGQTLAGCVARNFVQRLCGAGAPRVSDDLRTLTTEVDQALNPWLTQWNTLISVGVAGDSTAG